MLLHKAAINQIISNCACFPRRQETWHASKNLKSQAVHLKNWCFQQYTLKNTVLTKKTCVSPQVSRQEHNTTHWKNTETNSEKTFQLLWSTSSKVFLWLPDQRRNIIGTGGLQSDFLTTFPSLFINIKLSHLGGLYNIEFFGKTMRSKIKTEMQN